MSYMPKNIRRFVWLWVASFVLAPLALFFPPTLTPQEIQVGMTQNMVEVVSAVLLVLDLVIFLPFFWLVVWRQKSWARWVLFVPFVVSLPLGFAINASLPDSLLLNLSAVPSAATLALAFYFLFTGDARAWFQKENSN